MWGILAVRVGGLLVMGGALACLGNCASAQITPDATLGLQRSVVTPNVLIQGLPSSRIDGGAIRGANLFHSFQEFNIGAGGAAYFTNPAGINNILSRVTGSNPSNILGRLGVLGNANLFLMNPNGIIFGHNASLDLGGSFVATTANAIGFGNQGTFSAGVPNNPSALTVDPSAFLFNQIAAQPIVNKSSTGLQVASDRSLLLLGGNINLEGGTLLAPNGRIELGGLASAGIVGLNVNGDNLSLSFPLVGQRSDVSLTAATVNVAAGGGSSIAINARNLDILVRSSLTAGIGTGLGAAEVNAGDITLNATGAITLGQFSRVRNNVSFNAIGNGGDINIQAGSLSVTDGAFLSASTLGRGNAGNINIDVTDSVTLAEVDSNTAAARGIATLVLPGALGNGGDINIKARSLSISNGSGLSTATLGRGNAGSISINVADFFNIAGVSADGTSSALLTNTEATAHGRGGDININAGNLRIADGAVFSARTRGANNGGDIKVETNNIELINGGQLLTTAFSSGDAGNILIRANQGVTITGSDRTYDDRLARVGSFSVLPVAAASGVFTNTALNSTGSGGNISITTNNLDIINTARISTESQGTGDAGNISINAAGFLTANNGNIIASASRSGGGNIDINAKDMRLRNSSDLTTSVLDGTRGGGNININSTRFLLLESSDILATAAQGNGGNINLNTAAFLADFFTPGTFDIGARGSFAELRNNNRADISASSQVGQSGTVAIPELNNTVANSLSEQSNGLVNIDEVIANSCLGRRNVEQNSFVVTGTGGLAPTPYNALTSQYTITEIKPIQPGVGAADRDPSMATTAPWKIGDPIVEARALVRTADGRILLTTLQQGAIAPADNLVCHPQENQG